MVTAEYKIMLMGIKISQEVKKKDPVKNDWLSIILLILALAEMEETIRQKYKGQDAKIPGELL